MVKPEVPEARRLAVQTIIDGERSQDERNKRGQFSTPYPLAEEIIHFGINQMGDFDEVRFFDPAFGTGSFYSALLATRGDLRIGHGFGFEIDPSYGEAAKDLWNDMDLALEIQDFTSGRPLMKESEKPNLLICNPPYVRHHHLSRQTKTRLLESVKRETGIRLNGLSGLYCYFLLLSHKWMARDCIAGWLIPSEVLDVRYGVPVKKYLTSMVDLIRIHRFNPDEVKFDDALVTSIIVFFRNRMPVSASETTFSFGSSLVKPDVSNTFLTRRLDISGKWTHYPFLQGNQGSNDTEIKMRSLFNIKRGIATGANRFFILDEGRIDELDLPREFLRPILPSPRFLPRDEIQSDDQGVPCLHNRLFLLACDLSPDAVKRDYPSLWDYLQTGVESGIHERYLCRRRKPWYAQESREPTPFLCSYMGRNQADGFGPFRFILNNSNAICTNVYLMLYPKPLLRDALHRDPVMHRHVWEGLHEISSLSMMQNGRVYGGGLYKMEPRELEEVPIKGIISILPKNLSKQFITEWS